MHSVLYVRAMAAGTIKSHCMISKHVIAHLHMWLWCTLHPICLIVYRYIEIKSTFYFMTSTIQGRLMWQEKAFQSKKLYLFSKKKCTNARQIWILRQNLTPKVRPIFSEAVCTLISRGICHQNQFHGFLITIAFFFWNSMLWK